MNKNNVFLGIQCTSKSLPECGPKDGNGHSTAQDTCAPLCDGQMMEDALQRGNQETTWPL